MPIVTIFLIVLVSAFAAVAFFTEPTAVDKRIHARLVALDKQPAASTGDDAESIVKEIRFSSIAAVDQFLRHNRLCLRLQALLDQSAVPWTVGRFMFLSLASVALGAFLGNWWIEPSLAGWAPGLLLGALPYAYVARKRSARFKLFGTLLPEAIDMMSRGLRAGQALPATVELVATEISDPVGPEFRQAAEEQTFGLPFRETMLNLGRRVPIQDLHFVITAILVQKETGGNLAEILDKTSRLIRERVRIEGQMRIHSAQARATGWVLCLMPFAIFALMNILNPGYARVLATDPLGRHLVVGALVLMGIGILAIRRIIRVKV
ncbi:MAG TPA: type II secretion system F family protein [Terriglobales bacterium]|nr:type II secretion system F family protein [Terriglobales bacterium]